MLCLGLRSEDAAWEGCEPTILATNPADHSHKGGTNVTRSHPIVRQDLPPAGQYFEAILSISEASGIPFRTQNTTSPNMRGTFYLSIARFRPDQRLELRRRMMTLKTRLNPKFLVWTLFGSTSKSNHTSRLASSRASI